MNQESMKMSSDLLDMLSQLLDESTPQELLPMIARVACQALRADAAVLEIPAELANEPFRFAYPSSVAISSSAVRRAREEKKSDSLESGGWRCRGRFQIDCAEQAD